MDTELSFLRMTAPKRGHPLAATSFLGIADGRQPPSDMNECRELRGGQGAMNVRVRVWVCAAAALAAFDHFRSVGGRCLSGCLRQKLPYVS